MKMMNASETSIEGRSAGRGRILPLALCLVAVAGVARNAGAQNAVSQWSQHAQVVVTPGRGAGVSEHLLALVHAAMYDAVVAIEGRYAPFRVAVAAPAGASADAAAATAAYSVLVARIPSAEPALAPQYTAFLATVPDGPGKADGIAVGSEVAQRWLQLRSDDGLSNPVTFVQPPPGPGVWEPTASTPPADLVVSQAMPYVLATTDALRPQGPPPLNSARYASDWLEVKALGRIDSGSRTSEQLEIARFWAEHPSAQWNRNLRGIAIAAALDGVETARLLAMTHVAAADGLVACFDAKYSFLSWRPVHAIQRADTDGNAATAPAPGWNALLNVNHPEYPSGHACMTGAITGALRAFFGSDQVPTQLDSNVTGTARYYGRLSDIDHEVDDARVYAGLHFRFSLKDGHFIGRRAALAVTNHHFRAVD